MDCLSEMSSSLGRQKTSPRPSKSCSQTRSLRQSLHVRRLDRKWASRPARMLKKTLSTNMRSNVSTTCCLPDFIQLWLCHLTTGKDQPTNMRSKVSTTCCLLNFLQLWLRHLTTRDLNRRICAVAFRQPTADLLTVCYVCLLILC